MDPNKYLNDIIDFDNNNNYDDNKDQDNSNNDSNSLTNEVTKVGTIQQNWNLEERQSNVSHIFNEVEVEEEQQGIIKKPNVSPFENTSQHFQQLLQQETLLNNLSLPCILGGNCLSPYPEESDIRTSENLPHHHSISQTEEATRVQSLTQACSVENRESPACTLNSINISLDSNVNHENHAYVTRQSVGNGCNYDVSPFASNSGILNQYNMNMYNSGTMSMTSFFNSNGSGNSNATSIHNNSQQQQQQPQQQQQQLHTNSNPYREFSHRQTILPNHNNLNIKDRNNSLATNQVFDTNSIPLIFQSHQDFQYRSSTIEPIYPSSNLLTEGEEEEHSQRNNLSSIELQLGNTSTNSAQKYLPALANPFTLSPPLNGDPTKNNFLQIQGEKRSNDFDLSNACTSKDMHVDLQNPIMNPTLSMKCRPCPESDLPEKLPLKKQRLNSMNVSFDEDSISSTSMEKSSISVGRNTYRCSHCGAAKRKHKCPVKEMLFKREVGCQVDACLTTATEPTTPAPPFKIIAVRKSCPVEQIVHSLGFELPPRIPTCLPEVLQSAASLEEPIGASTNSGTTMSNNINQYTSSLILNNSNSSTTASGDEILALQPHQHSQFTEEQQQQLAYEQEQMRQVQLLLQAHFEHLSFEK